MPSVSKKQQRLMGAAYAYASGKNKDAPEVIKDIAKSFMKKGKRKGKKSLRDFAKTKHKGLPEKINNVKESLTHLVRFSEFKG
jgi:hypothetical protein